MRMFDEDDTVKDLAVKTVEELWFTPSMLNVVKPKQPLASPSKPREDSDYTSKAVVIMAVCAHFKDRQSPLEDILHKIMSAKDSGDVSICYSKICEKLIDGLLDPSDVPGFVSALASRGVLWLMIPNVMKSVTNCVRTIHVFVSAYPSVISGPNAATLLPYLRNPTTVRLSLLHHAFFPDVLLVGGRAGDIRLSIENIPAVCSTHAKDSGEIWARAANVSPAYDSQTIDIRWTLGTKLFPRDLPLHGLTFLLGSARDSRMHVRSCTASDPRVQPSCCSRQVVQWFVPSLRSLTNSLKPVRLFSSFTTGHRKADCTHLASLRTSWTINSHFYYFATRRTL